ncbi:MAG TPA: P-loop NTPase [Phycisphaerales bacterium]|nr:P-loop NTPase [Phycisphaerales bacterium]
MSTHSLERAGDRGGAGPHVSLETVALEPRQASLPAVVHRLLRGRYLLAIALSGACAVAGAVAGYMALTPKFESKGLVRVHPVMPRVLHNTENTQVHPLFTSFVNTHANLLKHDRVIAKAMQSEEWRALGRPRHPEDEKKFRDALEVSPSREATELISVSFSDVDPRAAKAGLVSVLTAYEEIYGRGEQRAEQYIFTQVMDSKRVLEDRIAALRKQIRDDAEEFGTDDLDKLYEAKLEQAQKLAEDLAKVEAKLPAQDEEGAEAGAQQAEMTPQEIALVDTQMAHQLGLLKDAQTILARLRHAGYGENHPDVADTKARIAALQAGIDEDARAWRESRVGAALVVGPGGAGAAVETTAKLRERRDALRVAVTAAEQETRAIGSKRLRIKDSRARLEKDEKELDLVNNRLDQLSQDSKLQDVIGRVEIHKPEAVPAWPDRDPRLKMAALGFLAGGGLPIAALMLLGLIDPRSRYADQARPAGLAAPLFGILPQLPKNLGDPELTTAAAHCVHQMRTLLQIGGRGHQVYAITSPTAGDGKTSLALSLGLSFAASGSRTVVVDFDLIGHGLSTALRVRPERGLGDALATGHLNGHVMPTRVPGLSVLAAGVGDEACISRLSEGQVARLVSELKLEFDTIVIDTGPILGSLEANFATSVADGTLLVVGRGQHRGQVERACAQLASLRANVLGLVFNRAHSTDFRRSAASTSLRSVAGDGSASRLAQAVSGRGVAAAEQLGNLDPVSRTVALDIVR